MTATTTSTADIDLVLALVDGCQGDCCWAGADAADAAETLTYINNTGAPQDLVLVVDGYQPSDVGPFTLDVTVQ